MVDPRSRIVAALRRRAQELADDAQWAEYHRTRYTRSATLLPFQRGTHIDSLPVEENAPADKATSIARHDG